MKIVAEKNEERRIFLVEYYVRVNGSNCEKEIDIKNLLDDD